MNLTASIESAELRFRQILEDFFVSVFNEQNLHSHGINHHRRVWSYAREILLLPPLTDNTLPSCDPEKLIIASYMHDIGMSADPGPRHGKKSRELCNKFLESQNLNLTDFNDLLECIENHDNKDYTSALPANDLLRILSLADDLDAFGFTGIYRYCDIYITRGKVAVELGSLIRENATGRFENFTKAFQGDNDYIQKHRKRFEVLDDFFLNYNKQAEQYDFETFNPSGYCGLVQLFILKIKKNLSINDFFLQADKFSHDTIIESYLNGLKKEFSADNQ
jgi:HD superfamily phosphodiesterase